ncbi:MAG: DUF488 domain-containing protein [Candidatus Pacearchaeota archaeon]|jgi:uncharacterized protein (DUF488 family)
MKIYTIGYGGDKKEDFLKALKDNNIGILVDVRSSPYSKYQSWTNKDDFKEWLNDNDIHYTWKKVLGGKPVSPDNVILDYLKRMEVAYNKAKDLLNGRNLTVMCSEADPDRCHRKQDLARVGEANGFEFEHILVSKRLKEEKKLDDMVLEFDF